MDDTGTIMETATATETATEATPGNILTPAGVAALLFQAYSEAVGGKSWNGEELPTFETIQSDPTRASVLKGWLAMGERALALRLNGQSNN